MKYFTNIHFRYVVLLVLSVLIGLWIGSNKIQRSPGSCLLDLNLKWINPTLDCDIADSKTKKLIVLEKNISEKINLYKNLNQINRAAVFVRDIDTNRFAGVNDGDVYYMASLLKLPLAIAGYKLAEVEPALLDEKIRFNGPSDFYDLSTIKPEDRLVIGQEYTVKSLIEHSIVYSDNDASRLLFNFYPNEFLERILQALSIQIRYSTGDTENPITAKTYAGVFRTLYNASYLNREYSNEILGLLTKTFYRKGATALLPGDLVVAHKFAERVAVDSNTKDILYKQLHECGIAYALDGKEPYIFCIMTEGDKDDDLEKIMQNISLDIYNTMITSE